MTSVLAQSYQATEKGIRQAISDLHGDLQFQRDLMREVYHRCLIIAKHMDSWNSFRLDVWVTKPIEKEEP